MSPPHNLFVVRNRAGLLTLRAHKWTLRLPAVSVHQPVSRGATVHYRHTVPVHPLGRRILAEATLRQALMARRPARAHYPIDFAGAFAPGFC